MYRAIALGIYMIFFLVHFSCSAFAHPAYPLAQEHPKCSEPVMSSSRQNADKMINAKVGTTKLNKRFQHESIAPLSFVFFEVYTVPQTRMIVIHPKDYLLIALILSQGLRGPPVVAVS